MNIVYIPFILYNSRQTLFILRFSSLLSSSNDASFDNVDDESSFDVSSKDEFTLPLYQTLRQNHPTSHSC